MFILITAAVVIIGSLGVAALIDLRNGRASGHLDPADAAQLRDEQSEAQAAARAAGMHRGGGAGPI
jgi:hypothetical protein